MSWSRPAKFNSLLVVLVADATVLPREFDGAFIVDTRLACLNAPLKSRLHMRSRKTYARKWMTTPGENAREQSPRQFDASRLVFYAALLCAMLGLSFAIGLHAGNRQTMLFRLVTAAKNTIETVVAEASTLTGTHPSHFLQPSRYDRDGVTLNDSSNDQRDLILLSGFFKDTNELRLIRRNGDIVARWPVSYYTIFPEPRHLPRDWIPATDWNVDTHGALALPDGSVVFNFQWSGLVKLDRCGNILWTVPRRTHHSVERAESGGFWVPGRRAVLEGPSPFPPFETPFQEDTILRISEDGRVLSEFSAPKIFYENGLDAILTATGYAFETGMSWDKEVLHLNKVEELASGIAADFSQFEAGDLLLSIRELNLLMVVDKNAAKVKWWKIGPWLRQHDPEFKPGGTIVLFNNNVYRTAFGTSDEVSPVSAPRVSNIVEINPATGEYHVLYGGKKDQEFLTIIMGKVSATPKGGLFITETEGGRVFETNARGEVVWEYVNHYSREEVAEISEARVYSADYFTVKSWSCGATGG